MKFLDQTKIHVRAGKGGDGCVSFLRAKNRPKGGPDGGDGGRGGDVVVEAQGELGTLIDLRHRQHWRAQRGGDGSGTNRTGRAGKDLVVPVPVGTQVFAEADAESDEPEGGDSDPRLGALLADLVEPGQRATIARGGKGGRGNAQFKHATNQAPRQAEPGEGTEEFSVWLRLKLLADIGLVGLPNAGKSTFLATATNAKPAIADYPFTTLKPQLGVAGRGGEAFVLADIPGLIEAAHQGAGLGDRFLGHVERCSGLLHLVEATAEDPVAAYRTVRGELAGYGHGLADKREWVALTKADAVAGEELEAARSALAAETGAAVAALSAVAGTGLEALLAELGQAVQAGRLAERAAEEQPWSPV